jgi:hypothetical protein
MGFQALLGLLSILILSSCVTQVAPWERGNLAKPHMSPVTSPLEASLRNHIQVSKEGSSGGHSAGGGGGGCGCN